jgi:hypothetical protein
MANLSDVLARLDRSVLVLLGVVVGLVIAVVVDLVRGRIQRRYGRGIVEEARTEANRLTADATREAEAAKNAGIVAGRSSASWRRSRVRSASFGYRNRHWRSASWTCGRGKPRSTSWCRNSGAGSNASPGSLRRMLGGRFCSGWKTKPALRPAR